MGNRSLWKAIGVGSLCLPFIILFNNCEGAKTTNTVSNGSSNALPPPDYVDEAASEEHFQRVVKPLFESKCNSCHSQPRFGGTATMAIFDFATMSSDMQEGPSATDNQLINVMQNIESHGGGNTCPLGINLSPCLEIIQWRQIERPGELAGGIGALTYLSVTGSVAGWARDPDNTDAKLTVSIYGDGDVDSGTFIGTFDADEAGIGGPQSGHYFSLLLPENFRDGRRHSLYVYAEEPKTENLLPGMPYSYTAYTPTAQGQNYFANTLRPSLNCGSCHQWDYPTAFASLLSPTPNDGATALNNAFINFASGQDNHPGGNFCNGGKNSGICSSIQNWWNLEFN